METLNCIYFVLFGVGVGYALVSVVLGGISEIDLPGLDIDLPGIDLQPGEPDLHLDMPFAHDIGHDIDHPEVGFSPLSPITIATFITTFGGVGLLVNVLTPLAPIWGLLIATASGLTTSGAMFLFYTRVLMAAQGSSEVRIGELVGKKAEVTAPIREGDVGEVAFVARGMRVRYLARSADRQAIPRGTDVEIVDEVGNVVVVRPKRREPDA